MTVFWTIVLIVGIGIGVRKVMAERRDPTPMTVTTRPSVTRVLLGGFLLGPIGALAGYAFRKKSRRPVE